MVMGELMGTGLGILLLAFYVFMQPLLELWQCLPLVALK